MSAWGVAGRAAFVGRPRTVNEGVEDELPVLLDEVVDVSEDAAHDGCGCM